MPNLAESRGSRWATLAVVSLLSACSKDKREDAGAAASSQAASAEAAPSVSHSPPPTVIERATVEAVQKSCTSICERSEKLKCAHADGCMKNCVGMAIGTPCSEPFAALYACLQGEPVAHWECGEDGIAAIREGYCEKEQERTVTCMEAKGQPGR